MRNPSANTSTSLSTGYLKIGQAAKALGVSIDTLRRWEKAGKITAIRTPGGTRLYHVSALKEINPSSVEHFQTSSLSTEELLRKTNEQSLHSSVILNASEGSQDFESTDSSPMAQNDNLKRSFVTKFLIGSAILSIITLLLTAWITASYLTNPNQTQQFFKNNVASGLFSPFQTLAQEAVAVIDPKKARELGFVPPDNPPPIPYTLYPNPSSNVLAVTASLKFLEVNADTQINGSLSVRDSINGLSLEATPSASTLALISGGTSLTVTNDALLDQDVSTASSPTFTALNLSATKDQLVFQSGGPTGTLTWTPTAARTLTLPDVTDTLVGKATTDTLTNKSMSGSSNTFTSIPNSALSNNKVTVTAGTNMSGGGDVSLGSSVTLSLASSPAISGVLKLADGTAAAPALTFTDDTNTGMYRIGADKIGLITAGTATSGITIDSSGQVGIGTISPSTTLYVSGTGTITGNTTVGGTLAVNGGTISTSASSLGFTDGTNTLFSIIDKGAYGFIRLSDKGATGDPSTCTAGDVYFNATDGVFKACTTTDAWSNLTAGSSGITGYWNRAGTTLSPATAGDAVTTSGNISTSGSGTITSAANITAGGDLAVNGSTSADITSTTDTATVFNSTVTTLSLGGAATTLNLGITDAVTRAINIGTGTGADTIHIGEGGTNANTITIGSDAVANTVTIGSASSTGVSITDNNWGVTTGGAGSFVTLSATPGTNATALTLTGTNVATSNLAYLNSKNTSGTILNLAYGAATTLTGDLIGQAIDLNNGQLTNSNYSVTGLKVTLPTVTDSNTTGTTNILGFQFGFGTGSGINQTGAGATIYSGVDVTLPAITQTAGTLTANGVSVTTSSSITTGGTANGVKIIPYSDGSLSNAGTLNGLNIGGITTGGASVTENAILVGSNWDNVLKVGSTTVINGSGVTQVAGGGTGIASYTAGDLIYASATTTLSQLAGGTGNNGKILTITAGVPVWASSVGGGICADCVLNDPTSVTSQTITPNNQDISSLVVSQTTYATPTKNIFEITDKLGTTKYFYVDSSGNVSTGGVASQTLTLTPTTNTTALTLVGTNVTTQPLQYINAKNSEAASGIFKLAYGAAQTLSTSVSTIGILENLATNVTATNATVTGASISLPGATNTANLVTNCSDSNCPTIKGLVISGSSINNTGTSTTTFTGADITIPPLTQTAGTLTGNGVLITTPTITTGGTANGINIAASGIAVGTLNGINISSITAGAGTETALNIGAGWDTGISVGAIAGSATTSYGINIGANTSTGTTNYGLYVGAVSGASGGNYAAVFGTTARVYGSPANATLMDFYGANGTTIVGTINNVGTDDSISLAASPTTSRLYLSAGSSGSIRLQRDTRVNQVPFGVYNTDPDCNGSNACERLQLDFSSNLARIMTTQQAGVGTARALMVGTGGTEAFRIDTSQNLGIGTTAPDARLEINHATGDNLRLTYNDSDGSATNYTDFSLGSAGDLTITGSAATLADGATAEKTFLTLTPGTITLTGPTQVTSVMDTSIITGATIAATNATTVNDAANLTLTAPVDSTNATLTRSEALRINDTTSGAGTLTSLIGLYIAPQTGGATNNYGICFDCDGTWTSSTVAAGIQFGTDANGVNLYRSANDTLKTDDSFIAGGGINSTTIGATTASTGAFTTLSATPGSDTTALTLTGTNVSSANLAYFNTKNTSGTIFNIAYGAATTLAGTLTGQAIDLSTSVTNAAQSVTGASITLPVTTAASTTTLKGISLSGGALTTAAAATTSTWTGLDLTMPNLTQGAGSTLTSTGIKITGGTVTSGTSYALITDANAGNVGIRTTAPDAALEINHATGDSLRLTYDDSNGSAANYTDFSLGTDGDLTINSSGNNTNITDDVTITTVATSGNGVTVTGTTVTTGNVISVSDTGLTSGNFLAMSADANRTAYAFAKNDATFAGQKDISSTGLANINGVFVYDTTKDTDGGKWTSDERIRHSSWYNETIDATGAACDPTTNDRCGRKEFPEKAIIVITGAASQTGEGVYIFDAKDNTMWMKFDLSSAWKMQCYTGGSCEYGTHVYAKNGVLYFGGNNGTGPPGEVMIDFIHDNGYQINTTANMLQFTNTISTRNSSAATITASSTMSIPNWQVNDTYVQVINGKTYVAVANNSAVSVVNMTDQVVYDYDNGGLGHGTDNARLTPDGTLYFEDVTTSDLVVFYNIQNDASDQTTADATYNESSPASGPLIWTSAPTINDIYVTYGTSTIDGKSNTIYIAHNSGLTVLQENQATPTNGSVKYYDKDKITEEAIGNIKGLWTFDEAPTGGAGSITDRSINGATLTPTYNACTAGEAWAAGDQVTGVRGTGYSFNGDNDNGGDCRYLQAVDETKLRFTTTLSVGAWVKPTVSTLQGIVEKPGNYYLYTESSSFQWRIIDDLSAYGPNSSAAGSFNTSEWYFVVGTYDGTTARLYVDGKLVGSTDHTASGGAIDTNNNPFQIGVDGGTPTTRTFNGTIDEPFATATVITPSEIRHMYEVGRRALDEHTASRITGVTGADNYQRLMGNASGGTSATNVAKAVAVDDSKQYIYVGLNDSTNNTGGVTVLGIDSDSAVDLYDATANTGKDDDAGTQFSASDVIGISLSGTPCPGYNSGSTACNNRATLAIAGTNDTATRVWMETSDISLDSTIDSLTSLALAKNDVTVNNLFRVFNTYNNITNTTTGEKIETPAFQIDQSGNLTYNYLGAATGNTAMTFTDATTTTGTTMSLVSDAITTGKGLALSVDGLTTGTGLDISSTSTAGTGSDNSKLLNLTRSGANASASHTAYGLYAAVTNTGTTNTNVAAYLSASGATNNYGLIVNAGSVGIGTTTPSYGLSGVGSLSTAASAVAAITNNNTTDSANTVTLRLNTGATSTTTNARFVTFYAGVTTGDTGGTAVGNIKLNNGNVSYGTGGADFGERFYVPEPTEPGDVIGVVNGQNGKAVANNTLIGVVSDTTGFIGNDNDSLDKETHPVVGLLGQIKTKVSTESGQIRVGDYLTSSSTPGVAMKATQPGQVIGKALESFSSGVSSGSPEVETGKILVFISPGFADPGNFLASLTLDNAGNLIMPNIKVDKLTIASEIKVDGKLLVKDTPSSDYTDLTQQVASASAEIASASAQIASAKSDLAKAQSDINDLKLTPPDILLATGSATLANLKVTSEATVSGMLVAYQAEIQDNFKVLGSSTLGNTLIAGDLTVDGTMSITGNSINAIGTELYLQNSPLAQGIDIFNGKIKIDKDGNITAQGQIAAPEVKTNKLTISNTPIATSSATLAASIGTGTLPANTAGVTIQTTGITDSAKVFITPVTATDKVLSVTNVQPGVSFDVSVLSPATSDIKFNWWIVETLI